MHIFFYFVDDIQKNYFQHIMIDEDDRIFETILKVREMILELIHTCCSPKKERDLIAYYYQLYLRDGN